MLDCNIDFTLKSISEKKSNLQNPAGRKHTDKSPTTPPTLAPQPAMHSHLYSPEPCTDRPQTIATGFQQYVKDAPIEIRRGQDKHNRRIMKLEETFNAALEFESQRITDLEKRVKELKRWLPCLRLRRST